MKRWVLIGLVVAAIIFMATFVEAGKIHSGGNTGVVLGTGWASMGLPLSSNTLTPTRLGGAFHTLMVRPERARGVGLKGTRTVCYCLPVLP